MLFRQTTVATVPRFPPRGNSSHVGFSEERQMTAHLQQLSIWTLEVDGRPTLAFEAKRYREANELCHQDWLRVELGLHKLNDVPLCGVDSHLRIRLARPAEMVLYRQAAEANNSPDDIRLVYLIELDNVGPSDE
jgi:hypothetical protein